MDNLTIRKKQLSLAVICVMPFVSNIVAYSDGLGEEDGAENPYR